MRLFPILHANYREAPWAEIRADLQTEMVVGLPWEMIAPHERQAKINHSQTLERLADRGGLSLCEALAVLEDRRWHRMAQPDANRRLRAKLRAWAIEKRQAELRQPEPVRADGG